MPGRSKPQEKKQSQKVPAMFSPKIFPNSHPPVDVSITPEVIQTKKKKVTEAISPIDLDTSKDNKDKGKIAEDFLTSSKMREILTEFQAKFMAELKEQIMANALAIKEISHKILDLEVKHDSIRTEVNSLITLSNSMEHRIQALNMKTAKLEDKLRRTNIKIRGIPDQTSKDDLKSYLQQLFGILVPTISAEDLAMETFYRLPKPNHLEAKFPRDTLIKFYQVTTKDAIMRASFNAQPLVAPYEKIKIFSDLSSLTLNRRREYSTVTKALRTNNLVYKWLASDGLTVLKENKWHRIKNPKEGYHLLQTWDISVDPPYEEALRPKLKVDWHSVETEFVDKHELKPTGHKLQVIN